MSSLAAPLRRHAGPDGEADVTTDEHFLDATAKEVVHGFFGFPAYAETSARFSSR